MSADDPVLPYAGTSGWSGSGTSHDRADREDHDGTTSDRQARTLAALRNTVTSYGQPLGCRFGITWKELADLEDWHHGQASGVLSVLHKTGRIARLTERRNRCAVYVLPEYVQGRETAAHGGRRSYRADADALADALEAFLTTPADRTWREAWEVLAGYRERTGTTQT
jgi:hypothetical protein